MPARKSRCPDCDAILINPRQCGECSWKAPGALEEEKWLDNPRRCLYRDCKKLGSVLFHVWYCSEHFEIVRSGEASDDDKAIGGKYLKRIYATLANAKGPMAKHIAPALSQESQLSQSQESEVLVQTEPGELG